MEKAKQCLECGSKEVGQGQFKDYAVMRPVGKLFSLGSPVIADVCLNCGLVLNLRVQQPYKFKKKV
ncbi:MAG: transcription initiation factor TFIIIB [Firmicutes bacterium]|nr:transcription initiation factor TFIIIB [Bacillota bacterium]